jgi:uncharacterized protein YndB with AHSA1/START domain
MSRNEITVAATPDEVFETLLDAWSYQHWVVGSKTIREVDDGWPEVGSAFHHTVGVAPLVIRDCTRVVEIDVPRRLVLDAQVWPTGENRVVLEVEERGADSVVVMVETPVRGPVAAIDNPLVHMALTVRNQEALRRLKRMVEQRVATAAAAQQLS